MGRKDVINDLETLTTVWRGDETETEGLKLLAHLYTEDTRYRDAFHVMRTALLAHPNSDMTRKIQDEAAITFESLFLGGKGDALPPVEALGLFYDFRELTPIGRRGDEMIRRLSDRLVRSICSTRQPNCFSTRSIIACKAARALRSRHVWRLFI